MRRKTGDWGCHSASQASEPVETGPGYQSGGFAKSFRTVPRQKGNFRTDRKSLKLLI
jgi:hypothetical protein